MIKQQQKVTLTDSSIRQHISHQSVTFQINRDSISEESENPQGEFASVHKVPYAKRKPAPIDTFYKFSQISRQPSTIAVSDTCKKCQVWKRWAIMHERQMMELEKQLMLKESKLVGLIKKQKVQLSANYQKISELENSMQLEESKISSLEKEITNISNKYEELKTQSKVGQTVKKHSKNIEIETTPLKVMMKEKEKIEQIPLETTEKFKNIVKTSSLTTKTQGWQHFETLKKPHMMAETTSNMTKRSEYEKCLFDNQTLRDYNTTLLQRLNSGRHKKVVY